MGINTSQSVDIASPCTPFNTINMLNEDLIGKDYVYTIQAYYMRDKQFDTNNTDQIINSIKKLGYYNINIIKESDSYCMKKLGNILSSKFNSDIMSKTIDSIMIQIKNSDDYKNFQLKLNKRLERSIILSKYLHHNDTLDFYKNLTLDELIMIGY
jgi:hypothetical protein